MSRNHQIARQGMRRRMARVRKAYIVAVARDARIHPAG